MHLKTKTPCCNIAVSAPAAEVATLVFRRKCRKCGQRWQVVARPVVRKASGMTFHVLEWAMVEVVPMVCGVGDLD